MLFYFIFMLLLYAGLESISRCTKLFSLKLGICLNITDDGLRYIGSSCSKLKDLDLYRFVRSQYYSFSLRTWEAMNGC